MTTFDTLQLVDKLKAAGIPPEQAEAVVRVIATAQDELVTRTYLDGKLERELAPIRTDLAVLKWMGRAFGGGAFVDPQGVFLISSTPIIFTMSIAILSLGDRRAVVC